MKKIEVKGRYLAWDDGEPFFYLADTAWELLHRLTREEMAVYFTERARQGFTAVQAVALAEFEGLTVPNAYGRCPLLFTDGLPDPARPDLGGDYDYWAHVDHAAALAAEHGLFLVILPTWGDKFNKLWGQGPEIFTEENAHAYGRWIGARYRAHWNIIWMLGGDRPLDQAHRRIVDAMAKGIREEDQAHLMTFHPNGGAMSTAYVGDAPYIDFHAAQSGHSTGGCFASDDMMRAMAAQTEKPYLDAEPRYEDHPVNFDATLGFYWGAADVRQNAYWNVLAGACGHTYGNHAVWSMNREVTDYFLYTWQEALAHEGAEQIAHVKKLRLRCSYDSLRPEPGLVVESFSGMGHMASAMGDGYAYVYSPLGAPFTVRLNGFAGASAVRAIWFDPRTGEEATFSFLSARGESLVVPPSQGMGCDWVLILEAVAGK